jgi:hypothetical protein
MAGCMIRTGQTEAEEHIFSIAIRDTFLSFSPKLSGDMAAKITVMDRPLQRLHASHLTSPFPSS